MQTFKFIENDTILLTQPHLIDILGRTGATLINQIHFWLNNHKCGILHNNKKWIYNTAQEWGRQIRLSERQIRHYFKKFADMGIISIKKLNQKSYDQTNYITLNYPALNALYERQNPAQSQPEEPTVLKRQKKHDDRSTKKTTNNNKLLKNFKSKQVFQKSNANSSLNASIDKSSQEGTVHDMIHLWHKIFPQAKVSLNKSLEMILNEIFKRRFSSNMMLWKNYLDRLQSSPFITSENFSLNISWALNLKTINRIFEGDLGSKDIPLKLDESVERQKAIDHVASVQETDVCKAVRHKILNVIGAMQYNAWFTKVLFSQSGEKIQFKAQSPFVHDYIYQHFEKFLTAH